MASAGREPWRDRPRRGEAWATMPTSEQRVLDTMGDFLKLPHGVSGRAAS